MYDNIINELLEKNAKKATHFITNKEIIRVTRTSFQGKFDRYSLEFTVTRGKPNYAEREWAKEWKKEIKGMTFFKYLPKKKVAPKRKK